MLENEGAVPRYAAGSIVIGLDHLKAGGVVNQINLIAVDVQPDADGVLSGHKRQAGNITDKYLRPHALGVVAAGLEPTMGGENTLPVHVVETNAHLEIIDRLVQGKMHADFQGA